MGIIKSFLNLFRSGKREEEEERLRAQKERYDTFLKALTEGDLDTRWNAVRSVGDLGEPFIEPLIRGLKDEYWIIRRGSADTLGKIGGISISPLIEALNEPGEDIRQETVRALLLIGEPAFVPLISATRNAHPFIRL
ncbi:MAG: HEAT repeat domain-containing protein, partial [Methanoregula sp.]|nr:HEAT repeat domain-containing protein [Methanoregula sp.]